MTNSPPPPAPGTDNHVSLKLVNSAVRLPGGQRVDELSSAADATSWLIDHSLVAADTTLLEYCHSTLTALRDDLRELFAAHVRHTEPERGVVERINWALTRVPNTPLLHYDSIHGLRRIPEHYVTKQVEHALAQIAEDAAALVTGPESAAVALCEASPCDRLMIRTHARRRWCSTRCGDRVRAARSYERRGRENEAKGLLSPGSGAGSSRSAH